MHRSNAFFQASLTFTNALAASAKSSVLSPQSSVLFTHLEALRRQLAITDGVLRWAILGDGDARSLSKNGRCLSPSPAQNMRTYKNRSKHKWTQNHSATPLRRTRHTASDCGASGAHRHSERLHRSRHTSHGTRGKRPSWARGTMPINRFVQLDQL